MEHTYLRYECGDAFGLTVAAPSSQAPASTDGMAVSVSTLDGRPHPCVWTVAGSLAHGWNVNTATLVRKLGHTERLSGGVGTGRALNGDQMVCLALPHRTNAAVQANDALPMATGWVDGSVRIFTVKLASSTPAASAPNPAQPVYHSLLDDERHASSYLQTDPLVLSGHRGAVRALCWHQTTLLASGANDGAILLWDVVAETGLYRLRGHRAPVTQVVFLTPPNNAGLTSSSSNSNTTASAATGSLPRLVSTSLDQLVKIWDLDAQVCVQTIATHRGEVTAAALAAGGSSLLRLVTGAADGHVRVWKVANEAQGSTAVMQEKDRVAVATGTLTDGADNRNRTDDDDQVLQYMGRLLPPPNVATSAEKIVALHTWKRRWIGVLHGNRAIHVYRKRSVGQALQKKQRRLKRRQQKRQQKENRSGESGTADSSAAPAVGRKRGLLDDDPDENQNDDDVDDGGDGDNPLAQEEAGLDPEQLKASDEWEYVATIRPSHKVRDFIFYPVPNKGEACRIVCALTNNALEVHSVTKAKEQGAYTTDKATTIDRYGHPTGIRAVSLSSDDRLACSVSKSATKIWNVHRRSMVTSLSPTMPGSKTACYGLCVTFLPGNTLVVMGTREGHLLLIDIASGDILSVRDHAHDGAVWNIDVRKTAADETTVSLVTGSADKTVKFWDVVVEEDENGHERPVLDHTRTLQMTDDVVAVKYSHTTDPTRRMIFVSTLDSTIKVFYEDSLKLFLSLYGHKLPALAVDASDDDALLVSGAADKTIKIWGLDFGDTHRTLHGHDDSITDIRMVPKTHNFFSSSKDGSVRYWDGDRFQQILTLPGHFAEVQCLAVSRTGAFVLSGGMDRQIRVWERTKDIVFPQEERERALERTFDRVDDGNDKETAEILDRKGLDEKEKEDGGEGPQSEMAVRKSILSIAAGDRLMEALEKADQETKEINLFKRNNPGKTKGPNLYLLGLEPAAYVLWVLKSIKTADLEQSLLVLPVTHLERLFYYLIVSLRAGRGVELCSRVAVFMVKVHQNQIIASDKSFAPPLRELRRLVRLRVGQARDRAGYDIAALRLVGQTAHARKTAFATNEVDAPADNVWAGLGRGSDVAALLSGRPNKTN